MKKLVVSLVAVVSALIMCFALAACSSSVSGNTYVYDSISVSWDKDVAQEVKDEFDEEKEDMEAIYKLMSYTFNEDGTVAGFGYWKQDGSKVYIGSKEDIESEDYIKECEEDGNYLTASGSSLKMEMEVEGVGTLTITFKKK